MPVPCHTATLLEIEKAAGAIASSPHTDAEIGKLAELVRLLAGHVSRIEAEMKAAD